MSFILRILFTGLMAFVPSDDGKEVTVVLLNVNQHEHLSDGSQLSPHNPVLIARAGNCTGQCPTRDLDVARAVFGGDMADGVAQDSLEEAVGGEGAGGTWLLGSSDITVRKGSTSDPDLPALVIQRNVRGTSNGQPLSIPTTALEREDFSWITELSRICPTCSLDPAVLGSQPPSGLVAARFKLRSGKVFTWSVARIGSDVTPVHFKRLDGTGNASSYSQAIATWVAADIQVSGDSVEIAETTFSGGAGRSMLLQPDESGKVELAVLNMPAFVPPASANNDAPQVGKHFEKYYELTGQPPAKAARLVPLAGAAPGSPSCPTVSWASIHPQEDVWSELLNKLRLDVGRGPYDRILCPPFTP